MSLLPPPLITTTPVPQTPPPAQPPAKTRFVPFAACEGFYNAVVYFIALLGGLGVLLFLTDASWTKGAVTFVIYVLLILAFLGFAERRRQSSDNFVVSFSRTNTTIVCD